MIVKWNSDINDGGKWLCGKVSSSSWEWERAQCRSSAPSESWTWCPGWRDRGDREEPVWPGWWPWSASCRHLQWPAAAPLQHNTQSRGRAIARTSPCRTILQTARQFSETTCHSSKYAQESSQWRIVLNMLNLRPPTVTDSRVLSFSHWFLGI